MRKYKSKTNPMIITGGSVYCKNCGYQYKWEGSYPISPYCPKCNKKINWNDYNLPREEKQMKFDCYKTLDFIHEFTRFCNSKSDCKDCTLFNGSCPDCTSITEEDINIIQKWSDTHPQRKDLKPCPFCGGENILLVNQLYPETKSHIECMKCGAKTNEFMGLFTHNSDDKAVEAWNRREDDE